MTGTWGRILARYGQSVTLRRGEEERACRAFLQPVRERREDWYQELPTPLGTVRRDVIRHDDDLAQANLIRQDLDRLEVTIMHRIEGAAIDCL